MHADEIDVAPDLVSRLIAAQFPQWASLPIRPVASAGTVHVLFRLDDDMLVRLPRRPRHSSSPVQALLPLLAPLLPVLPLHAKRSELKSKVRSPNDCSLLVSRCDMRDAKGSGWA